MLTPKTIPFKNRALLSTYGMAPPSYFTTPLPGRGEGCGKDPKLTNKRRKYEKMMKNNRKWLKIINIHKILCKNKWNCIKIKYFGGVAPWTPPQPFNFLQNPSLVTKFLGLCPHPSKFSKAPPFGGRTTKIDARNQKYNTNYIIW